jgi:hypothetical protein
MKQNNNEINTKVNSGLYRTTILLDEIEYSKFKEHLTRRRMSLGDWARSAMARQLDKWSGKKSN